MGDSWISHRLISLGRGSPVDRPPIVHGLPDEFLVLAHGSPIGPMGSVMGLPWVSHGATHECMRTNVTIIIYISCLVVVVREPRVGDPWVAHGSLMVIWCLPMGRMGRRYVTHGLPMGHAMGGIVLSHGSPMGCPCVFQ